MFVFLLAMAVISLLSCQLKPDTVFKPVAQYGSADLTSYDFNKNDVVWLDGVWEFYWKQQLNPKDFYSANPPQLTGYFPAPGDWTEFQLSNKNLPAAGYATFRLVVKISNISPEYGIIYPNYGDIAHRIWINGQLISEAEPDSSRGQIDLPRFYNLMDMIETKDDTVELVVQLSNFSYLRGFALGTKISVLEDRYHFFFKTWFYFLLFGGLFLMSIYHFAQFLFRRSEYSSLYFAIFCLAISYRTVGPFVVAFFPGTTSSISSFYYLVKLNLTVLFLAFFALIGFYHAVFPMEKTRKLSKIWRYVMLSLFLLFTILPSGDKVEIILTLFYLITIPVNLIIIAIIIGQGKEKKETLLHLLAIIPLLVYGLLELADTLLLITQQGYKLPYFLSPLMIYLYILIQSVFISRRFSKTMLRVEDLSHNLEKKVEQRTKELEKEKNKLTVQNDIMLDELSLARRIQMQFIPESAPSPKIAYYYKPMFQVGGDFFDFIEFSTGEIGIFISDVSGHGVPAALITSMIKGFTQEEAKLVLNPGVFLHKLNHHLFPLSAGNFVTAFYGIYDPDTLEFTFASAGHNHPLVIEEDSIYHLYPKTGIPLAIFDNQRLNDGKMYYLNRRIQLKPHSKLFMFTDGLVEATNIKEILDENGYFKSFEKHGFFATLLEGMHLSSWELVKLMVDRLIAFRETDDFEDDVCIICIETE